MRRIRTDILLLRAAFRYVRAKTRLPPQLTGAEYANSKKRQIPLPSYKDGAGVRSRLKQIIEAL